MATEYVHFSNKLFFLGGGCFQLQYHRSLWFRVRKTRTSFKDTPSNDLLDL